METVFEGSKIVKIDAKSRLALPASFRGALNPNHGNAVILTLASEGCLAAYRPAEWETRQERIRWLANKHPGNRRVRRYVRLLLGAKEVVVLDTQGRIVLPEHLRSYAGLTHTAKVIGCIDKVEIWDPGRFQEHLQDDSLGTLAELEEELEYGPMLRSGPESQEVVPGVVGGEGVG